MRFSLLGLFCFPLCMASSCATRHFAAPVDSVPTQAAVSGSLLETDAAGPTRALPPIELVAPWKEMRQNKQKTQGAPSLSWTGTLRAGAKESKVSLEFKGVGRRAGCLLPSLKIELANKDLGKELFDDDDINLTTHCEPVTSDTDGFKVDPALEAMEFGARECAAYSVVAAFGIPAFRTWIADVTYTDPSDSAATVKAKGCFIEKPKTLAKRVGGELEDAENPRPFSDSSDPSDPPNLGLAFRKDEFFRAALAQTLFGNIDYGFYTRILPAVPQVMGFRLRNTKVFRMPDKSERPGIHDFDLSVFVRGAIPGFAILASQGEEIPTLGTGEEYHRAVILRPLQKLALNDLFEGLALRVEAAKVFAKQKEIREALDGVNLGPQGRALIAAQADAFFKAIDPDGALNPFPR